VPNTIKIKNYQDMNKTEKQPEKVKSAKTDRQKVKSAKTDRQYVKISVDYLIDTKEENNDKVFSVNEKRIDGAVKTLNEGKPILLVPFNKVVSSELELRASVDEQIQALQKKEDKKNNIYGIIAVVLIGLGIWGIVAGIKSCSSDSSDSDSSEKQESIFGSLFKSSDPSSISSIDEAKEYLDGKTFIATPTDGSAWIKVTFSGNSFTLWMVAPRAGNWGNAVKSGTYKIKENRYANTGKRYFYAELVSAIREGEDINAALDRIFKESSKYDAGNATSAEQILIDGIIRMNNIGFIISESAFSLSSLRGEEIRYAATKGDKNPWN
jgi:hypothetical protein